MMDKQLLQRWIAMTGILLPLLVCLRIWDIPPSLSATWYTDARDVFTGSLAVVGGALGCFRGYDSRDRRRAIIACIGAMGVAWFPMAPPNAVGWIEVQGWIHFAAALAFFGALASMCLRLFPLSDRSDMGVQKLRRNMVYRTCGSAIIAGTVALAAVALLTEHHWSIFWIESLMVWSFGAAFAVKGEMVQALNDKVKP